MFSRGPPPPPIGQCHRFITRAAACIILIAMLISTQFWHFDLENRCQLGLHLASSQALSDLKKARIRSRLASASQQPAHRHSCIIFCPCATLDLLISIQFWHFDLQNRPRKSLSFQGPLELQKSKNQVKISFRISATDKQARLHLILPICYLSLADQPPPSPCKEL